jgi:hypothetical protein
MLSLDGDLDLCEAEGEPKKRDGEFERVHP